jgi:hypothetical protein
MFVRLLAPLAIFFAATTFGQQVAAPQAARVLIKAPPTTNGEYPGGIRPTEPAPISIPAYEMPLEQLIDRLVLTEGDPFVDQGTTYLRRESAGRISDAAQALTQAGKNAWGPLIRHLRDSRPSTPTPETTGPHTVGRQCYQALVYQVISLPRGYPGTKLSPYYDFENAFRNSLDLWLSARQDRPLESLRVEMLEHLIIWEREALWRGDSHADAESVARLESHLVVLRQELARVAR